MEFWWRSKVAIEAGNQHNVECLWNIWNRLDEMLPIYASQVTVPFANFLRSSSLKRLRYYENVSRCTVRVGILSIDHRINFQVYRFNLRTFSFFSCSCWSVLECVPWDDTDPRSFRSWCIKGTEESTFEKYSSVPIRGPGCGEGALLLYIYYVGMCCCSEYGFQVV